MNRPAFSCKSITKTCTTIVLTFIATTNLLATSVQSVVYVTSSTLSVTFSDAMDGITVLNVVNYNISGSGAGNRITPDSVTTGTGANEYLLTWETGNFGHGATITVTASSAIQDANRSPTTPPFSTEVYIPDGEWKFVSGTGNYRNQTNNHTNPGAHPGSRECASTWTDANGKLWLFGGLGYAASQSSGYLNDLWEYDVSTSTWLLVSEMGNYTNQFGIYTNPGAYPGSRYSTSSWTDSDNNLWLFGGYGYADSGTNSFLNDLWKYDVSTGIWEVVSGTGAYLNEFGVYPETGAHPGSRKSAATWTDTDGNLWLFGGSGFAASGNSGTLNDLWKYDVHAGTWHFVSGTGNYLDQYGIYDDAGDGAHPGSRAGAISWTDDSGNLWLFGGHGYAFLSLPAYLNDLWKYDVSAGVWTFISGTGNNRNQNGIYQNINNGAHPGSRFDAGSWKDDSGNLWLFGGEGYAFSGLYAYLNDLWKYDISTGAWVFISGTGDYKGEAGTYDGANAYPGSRRSMMSWTDSNDIFRMFGGLGAAMSTPTSPLNDMWKYELYDNTPTGGPSNVADWNIY